MAVLSSAASPRNGQMLSLFDGLVDIIDEIIVKDK